MARPERNTVDYYPHMVGEGKKMFFIENKYGNDGYATWHKILEKLCTTDYHFLNLNEDEEIMFLAAKCRVSEEVLLDIISDLSRLGSFDKEMWSYKIIWCPTLINSIYDAYNKRNNKCISLDGLRILLSGLGVLKPILKVENDDRNTQSKVEYSKVEENDIDFHTFWDRYDKKKDTEKCRKKWISISSAEKDLALKAVGDYVASTPDIKFRKNPLTWLNGKCWLDMQPANIFQFKNEVKPLDNNDW